MIIFLIFLLLTLVGNNQIVIRGARYGLMLWFQDVVPLLLPFILLSNLFVLKIKKQKANRKFIIPVLLLLGLLCGYPLGAKIAADFTNQHLLSKKTATILLPLCNNISPMFLSGYIGHVILKDAYPFWWILAVLYAPYILVCSIALSICHKTRHITKNDTLPSDSTILSMPADSILLQSVIQITYVGLYIMICSILFYLICSFSSLPENISSVLCGVLEITQGSAALQASGFHIQAKTALILACTSFGGICAFLQTIQVTQKSGLSMLYYFIIKLVCACMTGLIAYALVI